MLIGTRRGKVALQNQISRALEKITRGAMLASMVWATTVLFASLSAASVPAGRLASTYDDAACADGADAELALPTLDQAAETDCRPPAPVPPPAVIDCNDEREVGFLAEMIGSCD